MNFKKDKIFYIYNAVLVALFLVVILTPYIIHDGISIFNEEMIEAMMICGLIILGSYIYNKYEAYLSEKKESYDEMVRHIGALNLQLGQVKNILSATHKHPETPKEMKHTMGVLASTLLSVVNVPWATIRILEKENFRTDLEKTIFRESGNQNTPNISNKDLINNTNAGSFYFSQYDCQNGKILFVVLPKKEIDHAQEVIIKTITNNAGMIYLLYSKRK